MIRKIFTLSALGFLFSPFCLAQGAQAKPDKKATELKAEKKGDSESKKDGTACATIALSGNDVMKFGLFQGTDSNGKPNTTYVPIPGDILKVPKRCLQSKIVFTLHHIGQLQKSVMGHNLIIAETGNVQKVLEAGAKAGLDKNYIDPSTENSIVGATKVLSGGENAQITVPAGTFKGDKDYTFVCSFPGHAGLMNGKIQFVDDAKS